MHDNGLVSDQTITKFDGQTGLSINDENIMVGTSHNSGLKTGDVFTMATWLKHQGNTDNDDNLEEEEKHKKEHILCLADDQSKLAI